MSNNPPDTYAYDVFISYSTADKAWVRGELLTRLQKAGLRVCIDYEDFRPGAPAIKEIERAAMTSRKTLLVLTPNYLQSGWTEFERYLLQTQDPTNKDLRLLPVLKETCQLPSSIGYLSHVNFTDPEELDIAWRQVFRAFGIAEVEAAPLQSETPQQCFLAIEEAKVTVISPRDIAQQSSWECVQTIENNSLSVDKVVFSPDGNLLASREDNHLNLWDIKSGRKIDLWRKNDNYEEPDKITYIGNNYGRTNLTFMPDGKRLVFGGNVLQVCDVSTGECFRSDDYFGDGRFEFAISSPDCQKFISYFPLTGLKGGATKMREASTGKVIYEFPNFGGHYLEPIFSPDGSLVAIPLNKDGQGVNLYDAATGKVVYQFRTKKGCRSNIAFSPDGKTIAYLTHTDGHGYNSSSYKGTLYLWDVRTGKRLLMLPTESFADEDNNFIGIKHSCKINYTHQPLA